MRELGAAAGLTIRPATPADRDQLAALICRYQHEIQHFTGVAEIAPLEHWRRVVDVTLQRTDAEYLVVANDRNLVGFCALRVVVRGQEKPTRRCDRVMAYFRRGESRRASVSAFAAPEQRCAFVDDLYVEPEARRHGVALPLVRRSFDWARERGLLSIEAATWGDNRVVLSMARYFGFETVRVLVRKQL